jgi:hypothetical protein
MKILHIPFRSAIATYRALRSAIDFTLTVENLETKKLQLLKNQPCFPLVAMGVFGHEKKWPAIMVYK